ncbi:hypothetical protein BJ138DRAFT_1196494 [Hygrophoropsis aurantiaca]|uniref:Uncharacterized protein n=1 Tax=Hygrophoropsis aurantiaca TaxID=72124 RepID=A0ACB8ANH8_9AGAM|nr:hypothetical protein BJ138DRAFT_1196494 [Hygrophoropsis aurantiaca]
MASSRPTSLDDWASRYSERALPDQWPAQLWDSAWRDQIHVFSWEDVVRDNDQPMPASKFPAPVSEPELPVPSRICVMKGGAGELEGFQTKDVYVRDDYINIARRMALETDSSGPTSSMDSVGGVNSSSSCLPRERVENLERLPSNPFLQHTNMIKPYIIQVCGSPESGKSLFLHVLLRLRLNARLPTLLQFSHHTCYLFSSLGAHIIGPSVLAYVPDSARDLYALIPDAWCLVDSNTDTPIPSPFTRCSRLTIVQAAPPRGDRLDWGWKYTGSLKEFYMRPFSVTEAIVAYLPSERQLQRWYERYAPSARLAYQWAARTGEYEVSLDRRLRSVQSESLPDLRNLRATFLGYLPTTGTNADSDSLSRELFVVYPTANAADYVCDIPTPHLIRKAIRAAIRAVNAEHAQFRAALRIGLDAIVQGRIRSWRVSASWSHRPPSSAGPHALVPVEYDTHTFASAADLENGRFYIPRKLLDSDSDQARIRELDLDSFIYQDGTAYLFQYAVDRGKHHVRTGGLGFLRGLGVARIVYVGVVLAGQRPTFVIEKATAELYDGVIIDRYLLEFETSG